MRSFSITSTKSKSMMIESVSGKTEYLDDKYQIERFNVCTKLSVHLENDFYQISALGL